MIKYSQIKDISSLDFDQAIVIYDRNFPDSEKLSIAKLKEKIKDNKFQLWVSYEESKVIFLAILCPLMNTNFVLLGYVATDKNFRGKGIAKEFFIWWQNHEKKENEYLLLEVENPLIGEGKEIKEKRVNFYQKLGANIVNNITYILPNKQAPEMILMIYPSYNQPLIEGQLIKKLIISCYEQFYDEYNHPHLDLLLDNIPENIELY